jgi:glycosyltransferase involved in cell wall biosynthesis
MGVSKRLQESTGPGRDDTAGHAVERELPLAVCYSGFRQPNDWRWFEAHHAGRVRWEFVHAVPANLLERRVLRPNLASIRGSWQAVRAVRRHGGRILFTHEPRCAARCALFRRLTGVRVPHVAWSFNFTRLPHGPRRRFLAAAYADVDRFIVYSTMEQTLYSEAFGIPPEKIDVLLWGVGPPLVTRPEAPIETGEYISAVGGNARDYPTLMTAMARLPDIPLVVVMRPENAVGLTIPPNVRVRLDSPLGEANNIIKFSRFMVLPLAGSEVPCGHVTLVCAMHLGKAFVITNSSGVRDYVQDGVNSLTCEAADPVALAERIRTLWDDPERAHRLGASGGHFAEVHCGERAIRDHLDRILKEYGLLD